MMHSAYGEYRDSGVDWIGQLPSHWSQIPLKHLAAFVSRGNSPVYANEDDGIPVINQACIYWDGLRPNNVKWQESTDVSKWKGRLFLDDLLINSTGTGTLGRLALFDQEGEYIADGHVTIVRLKSECANPVFVRYVLSTEIYQGYIYADIVSGSTNQIELSREGLRGTPVITPPLDEQHAIAAFLDRETARIDGLIAKKKRLIDLLREKRQAVISHAVTKGLDPSAPMKDSGIDWLGEMPAHWDVKHLNHLVRRGTSITYGIVQAGPHIEGGIPYIRTSDMAGSSLPAKGYLCTSPEIDAAYRRSKVSTGDLVVAIRATVGKTLPVPKNLDGANLTQGTAKISLDEDESRQFLLFYLNSKSATDGFMSMAKGATFKEITLEMLRKFATPNPPLFEQQAIADHLSHLDRAVERAVSIAASAVATLEEYRAALITAAVTGKIDVRGEAPAVVEAAE